MGEDAGALEGESMGVREGSTSAQQRRREDATAETRVRERAFEALLREYQQRIYAFALRLSGSPQDAEEIAQDTFVRAYRALPGYSAEQQATLAVRPWLYRIALNVWRNRCRVRRVAVVALEPDADGEPLPIPGDRREQPEVATEAAEQREQMAALLLMLPERLREAVVLRHVTGMTYPEIAALLDQPLGTVKANVHRGTSRLRALLTQANTTDATVMEEVHAK